MKIKQINGIHKDWYDVIGDLFEDERYKLVQEELMKNCSFKDGKIISSRLTPATSDIYKVFEMSPFDIRVAIIGMSPYWSVINNERTAIGRAFGVPSKEHMTPSLKVIIEALASQYSNPALDEIDYYAFDYTLEHWQEQGVFLLNRYLTSIINKNDSVIHANLWDWFTKGVIERLSAHHNCIIFALWGSKAQEVEKYIDQSKHYVVKAYHPQAQNYNPKLNFVDSDVFLTIDELLTHVNGESIEWYKNINQDMT